jgi:hypothetical protein
VVTELNVSGPAVPPAATVRPTAATWTASGTQSATAYQSHGTRQRVSRAPHSRKPARPRGQRDHDQAATGGPKAPKEPKGQNPQATAYARTKKPIKGCRLIGFLDPDTMLNLSRPAWAASRPAQRAHSRE